MSAQTEQTSGAISSQEIVSFICTATEEVFNTMLGLEIVCRDSCVENKAPGPTEGVVSLIGVAGPWVGTGSVNCTAPFAVQLASQLLMSEYTAVNEEVLDAVAEVTNMIIGNVKTALEERLGPLGLSIPTVIYGRNFTTRAVGNAEWVVVNFVSGDELMIVQMCLTPSRTGVSVRPGFSSPAALVP